MREGGPLPLSIITSGHKVVPIMMRLCLNCTTRSVSKKTVSGGLVIMAKFLSPPKLMRYRNYISYNGQISVIMKSDEGGLMYFVYK